MPIPKPKAQESQEEFVGRCMSELKNDFPDQKQRSAVCFNKFREHKTASVNVFSPVTKAWVEKSPEGVNQRMFEVTVSGIKEDRDGEIMGQEAVTDMITQFKSGKIALFPNHGRDPNTGERIYRWQDIMGVWVDAKQVGDELKAVAKLNNAHPEADMLWNFMLEKMPVGFSIGGKPVEVVEEVINETEVEVSK